MATVLTLGLSVGFVLLLLSLGSALGTLETDPGALGRRYQLTAALPPSLTPLDTALVMLRDGLEPVAPTDVALADAEVRKYVVGHREKTQGRSGGTAGDA